MTGTLLVRAASTASRTASTQAGAPATKSGPPGSQKSRCISTTNRTETSRADAMIGRRRERECEGSESGRATAFAHTTRPPRPSQPPPPAPDVMSVPRGAPVAVAGATGVLGRAVVAALVVAGLPVVALVRPRSAATPAAAALAGARGVRVVAVDVGDSAAVAAVLRRTNAAALVSCVAGRDNAGVGEAAMRAAEVEAPLRLFAAAAATRGVARVVVVAPPLAAFPNPASPYLRAKQEMVDRLREAERAARAAAASATGPRPTGPSPSPPPRLTVYQVASWARDADALVASLRASRLAPVLRGGGTRLQPIVDADLASRIVSGLDLLADLGATVAVGGPEVLTMRDLWRAAGVAAGVEPRFVPLPRAAIAAALPLLRAASLWSAGAARGAYLAALAADVGRARALSGEPTGTLTVADYLAGRDGGGARPRARL